MTLIEPLATISAASLFTCAVGPSAQDVPVQELTTFGTVQTTFDFSRGDQIQFSVLGTSAEAGHLDELATDVWLDGIVSQRFRVISIEQAWSPDGEDSVSVSAVSYKRLLNQRHVGPGGLSFANVDQGDIVWGLIAHTQARTGGNWRVTKGTSITGQLRDREYVEGDNLGRLAENLQNVINGLWWDIDRNLVYSAKLPGAFAAVEQPLQLGVSVRSMTRGATADTFANAVFADASDETTPVWVEAASLATDPRGRWERAFGWPTVVQQEVLQEHAAGALEEVNSPVAAWTIDMEPARWATDTKIVPGSFATLVVPRSTAAPIGTATGVVTVQVTEVALSFDADGAVSVRAACIEMP